jgi:sugar phosphate permease
VFHALASRVFYGWVIVAVALLMNVASSPLNAAVFSFFVTPMREDLGWSLAALSWGFTLRLAVAGVSGPFVGILLDSYGPRFLGAVAGVLAGVCVIGLALVESVWAYYILFAISGLSGFGAPTGQLLTSVPVSKWFQANRGRALAIAGIGLPLGTTIFIPVVAEVIDVFGWRAAWAMAGGLVIGVTAPLCLLLMRKDPESVGMHPDGNAHAGVEQPIIRDSRGHTIATTEDWTAKQALHNRVFWMVLIAVAMSSLVLPGTVVYRVSYWEDVGLSSGEIALATVMDPLTVSVTGLFVGFIAERVQTRYLGLIGGVTVACSMLWMVFARDSILFLLAYNITWGIGMGFNITVANIVWPNYFGRRYLGTIRGMIFPVAVGASAASAPIFAILLDSTGNAGWVWLVTLAGFLIYALLLIASKPPHLSAAPHTEPVTVLPGS